VKQGPWIFPFGLLEGYLDREIDMKSLLGFFLFAASSLRHILTHFSGEVLFFYGGVQIER
jgi:hypothetical protein